MMMRWIASRLFYKPITQAVENEDLKNFDIMLSS